MTYTRDGVEVFERRAIIGGMVSGSACDLIIPHHPNRNEKINGTYVHVHTYKLWVCTATD